MRDARRSRPADRNVFERLLRADCASASAPCGEAALLPGTVHQALDRLALGPWKEDWAVDTLQRALSSGDADICVRAASGLHQLYDAASVKHPGFVVPDGIVGASFEALRERGARREPPRTELDPVASELVNWAACLLTGGDRGAWNLAQNTLGEHPSFAVRAAYIDTLERVLKAAEPPAAAWRALDEQLADDSVRVRLAAGRCLLRNIEPILRGVQANHTELHRFLHTITADLITHGERFSALSTEIFQGLCDDFQRFFVAYVVKCPDNFGASDLCQTALDTAWTIHTLAHAGAWETLVQRRAFSLAQIDALFENVRLGARTFITPRDHRSHADGGTAVEQALPQQEFTEFGVGRVVTPEVAERVLRLQRALSLVRNVEGWQESAPKGGTPAERIVSGYLGRSLMRAHVPHRGTPRLDIYLGGKAPCHIAYEGAQAFPLVDLICRRLAAQSAPSEGLQGPELPSPPQ